jgi:VWFA-related protein
LRKLSAVMLAALVALPAYPQQQQPTFFSETIEVRVINVDVVVTGKDGRPVKGLTREDFDLFENGKPQTISNFLELRAEDSAPPVWTTTPPAPGAPPPPPAPATRPLDARPRSVIVFLDSTTVHPFTRDRIFKPLEQFLQRSMRAGDHVMIVSWNPGLKVDLEFTSDLATTTKTLSKMVSTSTAAVTHIRDKQLAEKAIADLPSDYAMRNEIPPIHEAIAVAQGYAERQVFEQSQRVEALKSVIASMRGLEGRIALVLLTNEIDTRPGIDLFNFIDTVKERFIGGNTYNAYSEAHRFEQPTLVREVADIANSNGVTLYPIAASGLGAELDQMSAENLGMEYSATTRQMSNKEEGLLTLRQIAEKTGGTALTGSNNFDLAFNTLTSDMTNYYSLGYHTEGQRQDVVRSIDVKLRKKGYTVRSRQTFVEKSITSEMNDAVAANLLYPVAKNDLNVSIARDGSAAAAADEHVVMPVTIKIPTSALTLIPDGKDLIGQFSSYTAFMRRDGKVSVVKRQQHQLRFPASSLSRRKEIIVRYELTVDDKTEDVSVGIMDDTSHATGFATMKLSAKT